MTKKEERSIGNGARTVALAATLAVSGLPADAPAAVADQVAIEALALKLIALPAVQKKKEEIRAKFLADSAAATPQGLSNALDEMTFLAALGAANGDALHPKAAWVVAPPHQWHRLDVPGSRLGFDNPDNYYRVATLDGASRYEISVRAKPALPRNFSIMLYDHMLSEKSKGKVDEPIGGLHERTLKIGADGTFVVTIDGEPANGRPNHIQSNADAKILWIRNMFDDWEQQNPFDVVIKRVGGPDNNKPYDEQAMTERLIDIMEGGARTILAMQHGVFGLVERPNTVIKPVERGGGWGYYSRGSYKLAADEGLLVTVAAKKDHYLGAQVTDPWMVSRNSISASGSLNNYQAKPNNDGSYTFVISAKDPGIHNWLDTEGLLEGGIFIRWDALPESAGVDKAVRDVRVVKLSELDKILPADTPRLTPEQRKAINQERAVSYARRYESQ